MASKAKKAATTAVERHVAAAGTAAGRKLRAMLVRVTAVQWAELGEPACPGVAYERALAAWGSYEAAWAVEAYAADRHPGCACVGCRGVVGAHRATARAVGQ